MSSTEVLESPEMNGAVIPSRVATTPMDLIRLSIERGSDADQIGKLVAMLERLEATRAESAFNVSMNAAQAEMPTVLKGSENTHTKSRYANLETVQTSIRPIYTRHGFSLCFAEGKPERANHIRIVCDVGHCAGHTRHYWMELPPDGTGAKGGASSMNAVQGVGSTFTYGARYLTCRIFNVTVANEDTDGNGDPVISREQVGIINDLFGDCRDAGNPVDFKRFLAWLKIESLDYLQQKRFAEAVDFLNKKRRQRPENGVSK